jgi:hypothetical protein
MLNKKGITVNNKMLSLRDKPCKDDALLTVYFSIQTVSPKQKK